MRALPRSAVLLTSAALSTGCLTVGYEDAIGYRSRQAALHDDVSVFPELMAEAAETEPKSRLDNPKKTVLTHFLELAEDPRYLEIVEDWNQRGWVDEDMVCPVYRAHFAAHHEDDPAAAARSAKTCLDRARAAARADRPWELDLCLLEAPMLVETATKTLGPYLDLVSDPGEPEAFRHALVRGLTVREGFGPRERWGVTSTVTPDQRRLAAKQAALRWQSRLHWVLAALGERLSPTDLAIDSARGAMEVEATLSGFGQSFLASYAERAAPDARALAWGWVRAMKHSEAVDRLAGLGLWDAAREPRGDNYWYLCAGPPGPPVSGPLGTKVTVEAITVRADAPIEDPAAALATECEGRAQVFGPYPLEQVARTVARAQLTAGPDVRVVVRVRARKEHAK